MKTCCTRPGKTLFTEYDWDAMPPHEVGEKTYQVRMKNCARQSIDNNHEHTINQWKSQFIEEELHHKSRKGCSRHQTLQFPRGLPLYNQRCKVHQAHRNCRRGLARNHRKVGENLYFYRWYTDHSRQHPRRRV